MDDSDDIRLVTILHPDIIRARRVFTMTDDQLQIMMDFPGIKAVWANKSVARITAASDAHYYQMIRWFEDYQERSK